MARVPYLDTDDLPTDQHDLLSSVNTTVPDEYPHLLSRPERNVYRTLAHAPDSLAAFRAFGRAVREEVGLDARACELVILTTARELDASYEWHQHVRIGLTEGLEVEEILAIADGHYDRFNADEEALLDYVAAFVDRTVDDDTYDAVLAAYDEATVVAVGFLAGIYLLIARQMDALEVDTEEPFVGWHLENLER